MAIKTGLGYVRENFSEPRYVTVTVDADGQHRTDDVLTVTRAALEPSGHACYRQQKARQGSAVQ